MPSSSVSYRTLFSLPGGTFVAVSALARLPLAMSQLGTLLLVSSPQVSGRLGPGGLAAGVVALAIAIGSPFFGALTDRHGQRVVLLAQSLVGGTALIAEGLAAVMGAAWPVVAVMGWFSGVFPAANWHDGESSLARHGCGKSHYGGGDPRNVFCLGRCH